MELPQKRLQPKKAQFRMRAHCNPLSDPGFNLWALYSPISPNHIDWTQLYEQNDYIYCNSIIQAANEYPFSFSTTPIQQPGQIEIVDIGCGFGGLLFSLSSIFPNTRILGMEIRNKVSNFVAKKIWASRIQNPGCFWNIAVLRSNSMRHLTHFFPKNSVSKLFFCFPDPHFKKSNHRRRIINRNLLSEYGYILMERGRIYCVTDVLKLHQWHQDTLKAHPMFEEVPAQVLQSDPCVEAMLTSTEEGKKVSRNSGKKYYCVFEKKLL